jgi:3-deoxy-D-manno-octulosonic-acid transferase
MLPMVKFLYNSALRLLSFSYFIASLFHPKARLFISGRKKIFSRLQHDLRNQSRKLIWVHCASLGEFEQGRPVMEALRKNFPEFQLLLTFFSPSGYEVRKNYAGADYIYYLPIDTPRRARLFVEITRPVLAIFVKYEFWYNYTRELHKRNIPTLSVSCIFRTDQIFFKSYGVFFVNILRRFSHFFVQNAESIELLATIGITRCTLSGDTRFDRVYDITQRHEEIPLAKGFKNDQKVFVIGSCWPEDLEVLAPFINENYASLKFIIAPHEISEEFLTTIDDSIEVNAVRFSRAGDNIGNERVLLIDNIGMLSRLYRYGEFAYVGGAFGKGLHNILEAACYGIPIFFGNRNFEKFNEARDLILRGGAFDIGGFRELKATYEMLLARPASFQLACDVTRQYVQENLGATKKIVAFCQRYLTS